MKKQPAMLLVSLTAIVACGAYARGATVADLVERASPSVVYIESDRACGSGFVVRRKPHVEILTNHHVIKGRQRYTVHFFVKSERGGTTERKSVPGRAHFSLPRLDFGLIRLVDDDPEVRRLLPRIRALPLGDSQKTRVGESVFLIGSPAAGSLVLGNSVSDGIISGKNRHIKGIPYLQTTAAVDFGNSGGPLLNMRGEVIGIVTSKSVRTERIGFALPVHMTDAEHYGYYLEETLGKETAARMAAGVRLSRQKRYKDACDEFMKAQKLDPEKARPLMAEAFMRTELGETDKAVRLLEKAIAFEKIKYDDLIMCVLELGKIHGRSGREQEAIEAFQTGLARDPMHASLNRNIGVTYANSGRKARALAHWYVSLRANPEQPNLRRDFAKLLEP